MQYAIRAPFPKVAVFSVQCNRSLQTVGTKMWTNLLLCITLFCYRLPTNLREGNFFLRRLSVHSGGRMWPLSTIHWISLDRDLFKHVHFRIPQLVLTSGDYWITYCWRKWAVRILLECFLVSSSNNMRNNILAFYIWRLLYLFILRSSLFFGS